MNVTVSLPRALASVFSSPDAEEAALERSRALERFLADIERRAFKFAQIAVRDVDDALDIVQDAMLQLARRYAARPAEEWRPLFYRILRNRIRDCQRRRVVRARVLAWLPGNSAEEEFTDPVETAPDLQLTPSDQIQLDQALDALETAIAQLPERQQQAFMLRTLEGFDVAQTAAAMGCSEGSVKTHYFRAVQSLRGRLGEFWS